VTGTSGTLTHTASTTLLVNLAPPASLTATPGNAQASLSWSASTGANGYHVKRSTASGGPYVGVACPTGLSYVDTGLTNGTTYFYVVSASYAGGPNAGGESANSAQAIATPGSTSPTPTSTRIATATPTAPLTTSTPTRTPTSTPTRTTTRTPTPTPTPTPQAPPAPPSALTANAAGKKKINLHWTQSPSSGVTNNGIYRRTSDGSYPATPTATINAATSYNDTGLVSQTTYCYSVTAISAGGESVKSNESCDTAK
jgi:fibronectin type 3 domain-containing protein